MSFIKVAMEKFYLWQVTHLQIVGLLLASKSWQSDFSKRCKYVWNVSIFKHLLLSDYRLDNFRQNLNWKFSNSGECILLVNASKYWLSAISKKCHCYWSSSSLRFILRLYYSLDVFHRSYTRIKFSKIWRKIDLKNQFFDFSEKNSVSPKTL